MGDNTEDFPKQYIRIVTPSKEDIAYVKELMEKGIVKEEDLHSNMSIITFDNIQEPNK